MNTQTNIPRSCQHLPEINEDPILIYLDQNPHDNNDIISHLNYPLQIFNELDPCVDYLTDLIDEKVFLILSNIFYEIFISFIYDLPQLDSIYISCNNITEYENYFKERRKIKGIFNDLSLLCDDIQRNIRHFHQNFMSINITKLSSTIDLNIILKMFFFIQDLHQQIRQLHLKNDRSMKKIFYRGQGVTLVDFEMLKKSKGCLLSFNYFLSTTIDRQISYMFADSARQNSDLIGILFQMEINPSITTTAFASLDNVSYYLGKEKEVLFSMNTIFRIGEIKQIDDRFWQNDQDEQLCQLIQYIRENIEGGSDLHRMGQLIINMGHFNKAKEIYKLLLDNTIGENGKELAHLYHQLGYIYSLNNDLLNALSYYKQTLDITLNYLSSDDPQLSSLYLFQSIFYCCS